VAEWFKVVLFKQTVGVYLLYGQRDRNSYVAVMGSNLDFGWVQTQVCPSDSSNGPQIMKKCGQVAHRSWCLHMPKVYWASTPKFTFNHPMRFKLFLPSGCPVATAELAHAIGQLEALNSIQALASHWAKTYKIVCTLVIWFIHSFLVSFSFSDSGSFICQISHS
jgi:hypothetical protein